MKISSFKYLAKEGIKNTWTNRLMSISSIGVLVACMVLIGLSVLLSMNVNKMVGDIESENVVMVYFDDYNACRYDDEKRTPPSDAQLDENGICDEMYTVHNTEEAKQVCANIEKIENVASVEYISKEKFLEDYLKKKGEDKSLGGALAFLQDEGENPFSDSAVITMKKLELFDDTLKEISKVKGVDSYKTMDGATEKIVSIKDGVYIAGTAIIVILLIISLVIVSNTIRVTMYNRKLEISIMKAVGATDGFIRLPFVIEGIVIGIISAIIAEELLYCCYRIACEAIIEGADGANIIPFGPNALMIFGIFVAIGIVAGTVGSTIMIGKYLKREGSEFAAI